MGGWVGGSPRAISAFTQASRAAVTNPPLPPCLLCPPACSACLPAPLPACSKARPHPRVFCLYVFTSLLGQFVVHMSFLMYLQHRAHAIMPPVRGRPGGRWVGGRAGGWVGGWVGVHLDG